MFKWGHNQFIKRNERLKKGTISRKLLGHIINNDYPTAAKLNYSKLNLDQENPEWKKYKNYG